MCTLPKECFIQRTTPCDSFKDNFPKLEKFFMTLILLQKYMFSKKLQVKEITTTILKEIADSIQLEVVNKFKKLY